MKERTTTAERFLKNRQWTKFLMSLPLGLSKGYFVENANDLFTIRVRATQLNKSDKCDREFKVLLNLDTKVATITATLKNTNDD